MSKNERTHGEHMATMGELHGLYKLIIVIINIILLYRLYYLKKSAHKKYVRLLGGILIGTLFLLFSN